MFICDFSFAVLDAGLVTPENQYSKANKSLDKSKAQSKNSKTMVANSIKQNKDVVFSSMKKSKSLGNVPLHIKENWHLLNNDQKEIIYSYHNENPYAKINKEYFDSVSKEGKAYTHENSAYGFDNTQQNRLDDLRGDINGVSEEGLSESAKSVVDNLAALEN